MIRILLCLGTRPEAIKMYKLIEELKKIKRFSLKVVSTGQHGEMLTDVLHSLGCEVDLDLKVMKTGQSLSMITASVLEKFSAALEDFSPSLVIVHGDTSSAFAAALAAFYMKIPVAHIEAGLRSGDMENPYPEEFNRIAISRIARYHFAPTEEARLNLVKEGVSEADIFVTGNTVIDAVKDNIDEEYKSDILPNGDFVLLTAHRRENIPKGLAEIFSACSRLAREFPDTEIIYPLHKNERIRKIADEILAGQKNVRIIEPLMPYDFHNLLYRCKFVITDSGGIQEESAYLGKPALLARMCTERKELLSLSSVKLVGVDKESIYSSAKKLLTTSAEYASLLKPTDVLGRGDASKKIAYALYERLST